MKINSRFILTCIIVLSFMLCFSAFYVYADETDSAEIKFSLGDNRISINGSELEYETPYCAEPGVVLVPVSVISQGLGAEVILNSETSTAKIVYTDVVIELIAGSKIADVNGIAQTLDAAPEIKNSVFMVPLRFIAENLGAEVSYDSSTSEIFVSKNVSDEDSSIIHGGIESLRIGDSKFNWSIESHNDLTMERRSKEGKVVVFSGSSYYDGIEITITDADENYDIEREYYFSKYSDSEMTLVKTEKDFSDLSNRYFRVQKKSSRYFQDRYVIVTYKYCYDVLGTFDASQKETYEEYSRIISSFKVEFDSEICHDIYKKKDKNELKDFSYEDFGLSFDIPVYFREKGSLKAPNSMYVISEEEDDASSVSVTVYSLEDDITAEKIAKDKYDFYSEYADSKIFKLSNGVKECEYSTFKGYEFTANVDMKDKKEFYHYFCFTSGDYIYCFNVHFDSFDEQTKKTSENILNSISLEPIDKTEFGNAIYNLPPITGETYEFKNDDFRLTIPEGYIPDDSGDVCFYLFDGSVAIDIAIDSSGVKSLAELKEMFNELSHMESYMEVFKTVQPLRTRKLGKMTFLEVIYEYAYSENDDVKYMHLLGSYSAGHDVVFGLDIDKELYSQKTVEDFISIVKSFEFIKKK